MSNDTKTHNSNSSSDGSDGETSEFENIPTPSTGQSECDGAESDFSHLTDLEEDEKTDTEEQEKEQPQRNDTPVPDEDKERLQHIRNLENQLYDAQYEKIELEMKLRTANSKIQGLEDQMEEREAYFRETLRSLGSAGSTDEASDEKASGSAGQALSQALEEASESKRTIRNLKAQLAARNSEIYEKGLKIDEMRLALMNSECKSEQLEKEAVEHRRQASNGPQRALNGPDSGSFEKRLIETAFGPQDKEFELKMELEAALADLTATNQQIGMMYERNEQEKDALKRQHAEVVADKDRVIEELNATIQLLQQW